MSKNVLHSALQVLAASLECHGVRFTCMHLAFVLNEALAFKTRSALEARRNLYTKAECYSKEIPVWG